MKTFGARSAGLRLERLRALPLWDGERLRNVHPVLPGLRQAVPGQGPTLKDFLCGGGRRVPEGPLPSVDPRPAWRRRAESGLRATWLGHSTVLLDIDGHKVLTDPVWGRRASPSRLVGPKRFQPVPVHLADVQDVDCIVISHDHYDHLDLPTIRALRRSSLPFVVSLGVGAHLEAWGIAPERITELAWWESHTLPGTGLTITAAPSQHFSGRGLKDRNQTLWSSMVMAGPRHRVFFSGDTGLTTQYGEIAARLGPFDLVMLEVGAFHPSWGDIHLGPEHALEAWDLLGSGALLPVHWGTFNLAMHAWDEPVETLFARADSLARPLLLPRLGEPVEPAQAQDRPQAWWRAAGRAAPGAAAHGKADEDEQATTPQQAQAAGLPWPLD